MNSIQALLINLSATLLKKMLRSTDSGSIDTPMTASLRCRSEWQLGFSMKMTVTLLFSRKTMIQSTQSIHKWSSKKASSSNITLLRSINGNQFESTKVSDSIWPNLNSIRPQVNVSFTELKEIILRAPKTWIWVSLWSKIHGIILQIRRLLEGNFQAFYSNLSESKFGIE